MLNQIRTSLSVIIIMALLLGGGLPFGEQSAAAEKTQPVVTTNAASDVTTNSATLNGSLASVGNYNSANVSFEWGTTSGNLTQETTPEVMNSTGAFSANLTGLSPDTTYYFRAKATGSITVYGNELSFSTGKVSPVVTTNAASDVTTNSAALNGSLASVGNYNSANVSFEWGTTSGNLTQETTPETMTSTGAFSANLAGLAPDTTYYFRAKATGNVTVYGDELSFSTGNVSPVVTTNGASDITTNSAALNGSLASLGDYSPVNVSFEWGITSGALDQDTTSQAMTSTGAFSANLAGLSPDTTYYFRAKATGNVTVYGDELSFTTGKVSPVADGEELDLPPIELPEKGNPKLDSQLNQLVSAKTPRRAASFAKESNIDLVEDNVRVIVECLPDQVDAAVKAASALGVVETSYRNLLQVVVPISKLKALADTPGIRLVRLPWYPLPAVVSEGVALINADEWQTAGYTGAGVKVAILDGGFTGYSSLLGTELPASVTTQCFYAGSDIEGDTVHGTACAEIVYDIAPDADFYLVNFGTDVEMGNAVDWLIAQGVDVISCSMGWPIYGPGDGTGPICEMVDDAHAADILWSQSIGNYAEKHWQGDFVNTDNDTWHEFFDGDETNEITVNDGDTIIVALKWDDTWGSSSNDYDLYLFDNTLAVVAWSTWIQDGDDDPTELLGYIAQYPGVYHIAIDGYYATATANFHLYSYYDDLQYQVASSSFVIPADSANATAVGAVDYSTPTTLESFSSRGPTKDNRIKPDLVAPDGVTTVTYSPFYGTSASAPHAAGAAALVKERYPSYTPAQIQSFLEGRAVDLGAAGKDNVYGSGRLYLGSPGIVVNTNAADNVTTSSAILHGSLDYLGDYSSANVSFEWGTISGALDQVTTPEVVTSTGNFTADLSGLSANITYYFKAKATGSVTVYGDELSFTTLSGIFIVNTTDDIDDGTPDEIHTSLREAINAANANPGTNTIKFNIPGTGPHTIQPTSTLPTITDPVIIDGYTQPGASPNTNSLELGSNAVLMIELDGSNVQGGTLDGLYITGGNSTVRGLVINQFGCSGIRLSSNSNVIEGNFIGTDVTGILDLGNNPYGVWIEGSANNLIGGTTAEARNLVSGNGQGVRIEGSGAKSNVVQGNFIGTDVTGTVKLGNGIGMTITLIATENVIGGTASGAGNVISGNGNAGVELTHAASGNLLQGNFIGTDVTGTLDLGNSSSGVYIYEAWDNTIGGRSTGEGNTIAFNGSHGVFVSSNTGNAILSNSIFSNAGLGIDLGTEGVTPNDTGDADMGANNLQNFPVLTRATSGSTTIEGTFNSAPNTEFRLEFFSNSACDPSSYGEGETFLGSANVTTNGSGNVSFTVTFAATITEGHYITATAIDPNNNTSEFSECVKILVSVEIAPDNPTIALGRTQQFTATGTYSDNSTVDITDNVTWTSDNISVATIGENTGLAQSLAEGQTTITATLSAISDNITLTISPKVLDAIAVTPVSPSIVAGRTQQFIATGTYSDNSTDNITGTVTWSSDNTTVARINAAGLATSYVPGTANITASMEGKTSPAATLTVTEAVLDSVIVTPVNPTIVFVYGNAPTLHFMATASYSDGFTTDNTSDATWSSSNETVAKIDSAGLAVTEEDGTTVITATLGAVSGNTTLTVLPDTVAPVVTLSSPAEGLITSSENLTVTGNVDDVNVTANLTVNGEAPSALTLGGSGNFSDNVTVNADSNTILVTAVDGSGNTGTSGTITVVVDPNKPNITITQPVAGIVTDNSSLNVIGTVSGNVTSATLILNAVSQPVTVVGGSFTANVTLAEGTNVIAVNAYPADHEADDDYLGTSGVRMVTLDTTPPVVIIDCPVSGSVVSTPGRVVSGTVDDPDVSTANLTLDGTSQSIPVVGGSFSQNITLVSGNNTITVVVTDEAGNTSSANLTIAFDNTKPEVTITAPANKLVTNTANQTVTGTVNDPTITTATLYLNDDPPETISIDPDGNFSENVTLTTGANTLEVRATDSASNTGTSGVVNVTVDDTAPVITIGLSDPTDSIAITVSSNEALTGTPTLIVNSGNITMTKKSINRWSGTYGSTVTPIATGNYTVTATGTDKAGNSSNATATFCKQTVTTVNMTAEVTTATTTLEIHTTDNITDASISVTQHLANPSGNVGNPTGAAKAAGAFVEIVASPELLNNLEEIYITVDYDPNELPPNTAESTLKLYLWDVASGTWQVVPGSGVNTGEHYIYGTVTHLSKYGGFGTVVAPPPPPSPPPTRGGGGGVGGGPLCVTIVSNYVTSEGEFKSTVTAKCDNGKVVLTINKGVVGKTKYGNPLSVITIDRMEEPPAPPADASIVGLTYDLGPDGATFDPPITLTITYDPDEIPAGLNEEDLVIAIWDKDAGEWVELDGCTVDPVTHTITAPVSHFTQFAVIAKLPPPPPPPVPAAPAPARAPVPASFAVSDLLVTPKEVKPAEEVTISAVVTNTGGSEGSYTVVLKINGTEEARKEVTLGAGKSETVTFTITKGTEGSYTVNIDGKAGQFTVIVPPPPTPTPTEALPVQPPTNWWLTGGIIAGCVVVVAGLLVYFFVWRKRGALRPS